jgi:hypothetical protein
MKAFFFISAPETGKLQYTPEYHHCCKAWKLYICQLTCRLTDNACKGIKDFWNYSDSGAYSERIRNFEPQLSSIIDTWKLGTPLQLIAEGRSGMHNLLINHKNRIRSRRQEVRSRFPTHAEVHSTSEGRDESVVMQILSS